MCVCVCVCVCVCHIRQETHKHSPTMLVSKLEVCWRERGRECGRERGGEVGIESNMMGVVGTTCMMCYVAYIHQCSKLHK